MVQDNGVRRGNYIWLACSALVLSGFVESSLISEDLSCPRNDDSEETLLPVAESCNYFKLCRKNSERIMMCANGLKFDAIRRICDRSENVVCLNTLWNIILKSAVGVEHPGCPAKDPNWPVLLPHETECGKFYICSNGLAYEKNCLKGLHFNNKIKVCDYPENSGCDKRISNDDSKNVHVQKCAEISSKTALLLPHESDCSSFIFCQNGKPIRKKCPNGLHFNAKKMVCDFPEAANCEISFSTIGYKIGKDEKKETTGFPSPFCPKVNGKYPIFFQHTENCSIYYMCGNGIAYEFTCPSGLHFNLRKKVCDDPSRAGCLRAKI